MKVLMRFPWTNCQTSSRYPRPRYQVSVYRTIGPLVQLVRCLTQLCLLKIKLKGTVKTLQMCRLIYVFVISI